MIFFLGHCVYLYFSVSPGSDSILSPKPASIYTQISQTLAQDPRKVECLNPSCSRGGPGQIVCSRLQSLQNAAITHPGILPLQGKGRGQGRGTQAQPLHQVPTQGPTMLSKCPGQLLIYPKLDFPLGHFLPDLHTSVWVCVWGGVSVTPK